MIVSLEIMMIRLKKAHLFILIFIFTLIFFMIQLMFNMKLSFTANFDYHYNIKRDNPKFNVLSNHYSSRSNQIALSRKLFKKVLIDELVIPLDSNSQPFLFNLLPFYHMKNKYYANFNQTKAESLVVADEDDFAKFDYNKKNEKQAFVNIEDENMIKNREVLKDSDLVQLLPNETSLIIKGARLDKLHLYAPDSNGLFKCIDSNQKIPYSNLNDDFCDCIDGTDEPGTSACPYSSFYCSTQNEFLIENFIPSSRVNDNICDCCDGSDENESAKCINTCDEKIALMQKNFYENKKALAEKEKYIIHGLFNNDKQYGPRGVFYKLSKKCFKIEWSEYVFEVCPYKKCTQFKNSQSTNIGAKASLILSENQNKKKWILKMSDGDAKSCDRPRESFIHFECHSEDRLKKVEEPEKCLYKFTLLTPAAC